MSDELQENKKEEGANTPEVEKTKKVEKTKVVKEPSANVIATLYQKKTVAEHGKGAVFSEKEATVVKPAACVQRSYVETFNNSNSIGRFYVIDEKATEKLNAHIDEKLEDNK